MIKKKIKEYFPFIYEYYLKLKRRYLIFKIKYKKKMKKEEYPKYIAKQYYKRIGHPLNWNNLTTYTEKMQWEKIYDENPYKSQLSDKFLVRKWVEEKIGKKYLIPLLGVWDSFDKINFDLLPDKFVLKTNHGSGTNIIVKDKKKLNKRIARQKFNDWMDTDFGFISMELHYSKIIPKIIAEQYMETEDGELQDYKFLCFDGKPYYCWVDIGRYSEHTRNVYDLNWNLQSWKQEKNNYNGNIPKPKNLDKMIEIVKILAKDFSHVRVDLYNINGHIYFGEMTFTNGGGYDRIFPTEYDKILGDLWKLPINRNKQN